MTLQSTSADVVSIEKSSSRRSRSNAPGEVAKVAYRPVTRSQTAEKKAVEVISKHVETKQSDILTTTKEVDADAVLDEDMLDAEGEDDIEIDPESDDAPPLSQTPSSTISRFTFVSPSTSPVVLNASPDHPPSFSHKPRIALPVPVPNLTKKSRGRRVPTRLSDTSGPQKGKGAIPPAPARMYMCNVETCGKCFSRGEHLKRHIRSIHTHDKRRYSPKSNQNT